MSFSWENREQHLFNSVSFLLARSREVCGLITSIHAQRIFTGLKTSVPHCKSVGCFFFIGHSQKGGFRGMSLVVMELKLCPTSSPEAVAWSLLACTLLLCTPMGDAGGVLYCTPQQHRGLRGLPHQPAEWAQNSYQSHSKDVHEILWHPVELETSKPLVKLERPVVQASSCALRKDFKRIIKDTQVNQNWDKI